MAILGAHMSMAGGYYKAVEEAHLRGCDCVQLFTKNNNQWQGKPIETSDCERFQAALAQHQIVAPLSHTSYLINLASPDDTLWKRSIEAMVVEFQRAHQLGISQVVLHPGSPTTESDEFGLTRIVQGLRETIRQTPELTTRCLLETTAGQGRHLGHRFEHLATLLDDLQDPQRFGVCVDTCHIFAAGYPLSTKKEYETTMNELVRIVGLESIHAFHLNDSQKPLGSRVDRHAHIGHGEIGTKAFGYLLNDRRWHNVPMYLETPKEELDGRHWDEINLETLRAMIK